MMKTLCDKAGIKPFTTHAIRRLSASIPANEGQPMIAIQHMLRHRRLATTERHVQNQTMLRPVVNLPPSPGKSRKQSRNVSKPVLQIATSL